MKASSDEGSVFLFRNSSFLLWFLLNLEGLALFFLVTAPSAVVFLVSREKEKEEAMEREMLNVCPMLVSAWQKSKHLVTRAGSSLLIAADIIFTGQSHIGEVSGVVKITERLPVILSELIGQILGDIQLPQLLLLSIILSIIVSTVAPS